MRCIVFRSTVNIFNFVFVYMFCCVYFDCTVEKLMGGGDDCKGPYFMELLTETFVLMYDFLTHSFEPPNCLDLHHT